MKPEDIFTINDLNNFAEYLKSKGFVYDSNFEASQGEPFGTYVLQKEEAKYSVFLSKVYTRYLSKKENLIYTEENVNLSRLKVLLTNV